MTLKQQIEYTRLALAIAGIQADDETCELIIGINELLATKQGATDLRDMAILKAKIREKYKKKNKQPDETA